MGGTQGSVQGPTSGFYELHLRGKQGGGGGCLFVDEGGQVFGECGVGGGGGKKKDKAAFAAITFQKTESKSCGQSSGKMWRESKAIRGGKERGGGLETAFHLDCKEGAFPYNARTARSQEVLLLFSKQATP